MITLITIKYYERGMWLVAKQAPGLTMRIVRLDDIAKVDVKVGL